MAHSDHYHDEQPLEESPHVRFANDLVTAAQCDFGALSLSKELEIFLESYCKPPQETSTGVFQVDAAS